MDAPAISVVIVVAVRSEIVPPPLAAVATWKKLEKELPVEPFPMFEMLGENETAVPTVALAGAVAAAAVRSGNAHAAGAVAETTDEYDEEPALLVAKTE